MMFYCVDGAEVVVDITPRRWGKVAVHDVGRGLLSIVRLVLGSSNPFVKGMVLHEERLQVILDVSEGFTGSSIAKLRQSGVAIAERALSESSPKAT